MDPLNTETLQYIYIAHELEDILELAGGLDLSRESERKGSGILHISSCGESLHRVCSSGEGIVRAGCHVVVRFRQRILGIEVLAGQRHVLAWNVVKLWVLSGTPGAGT